MISVGAARSQVTASSATASCGAARMSATGPAHPYTSYPKLASFSIHERLKCPCCWPPSYLAEFVTLSTQRVPKALENSGPFRLK